MTSDRSLPIELARLSLKRVIVAVSAINIVLLWFTYAQPWFQQHDDWRVAFVGAAFDLGLENNLGAWYASMLLLGVAIAMLCAFAVDRGVSGKRGGARLAYGWLILACIFVLLSADELGSLHERPTPLTSFIPSISQLDGWVGFLAIPILIVAVGMLAFAWYRVRESQVAFTVMTVGVLLFLSVPVQEQFQEVVRMNAAPGAPRPPLHTVLEEGAEVFGSLFFMTSALLFIRMRKQETSWRCTGARTADFPLRAMHLWLFGGGMLVLLVGAELLYPRATSSPRHGVPQNWFPSAVAMLVALLSLRLAGLARASATYAPRAAALVVLALMTTALAADHGADHRYTEWLLSNRAAARDALIAVAIAGSGIFFWLRVNSRAPRQAVVAWVVLLLVVFAAGPAWRVPLSLLAHFALLIGMREMLPSPHLEYTPGASSPRVGAVSAS